MCRKISYYSRREARRARRRFPSGGHLNIYWCAQHRALHLGHLPPIVIRGLRSKAEVYG